MTATRSIELPAWMAEQLSQVSPHLLRQMVQIFAEALMSADADAVCGAAYGQRSPDRRNIRDGYRWRGWDTRGGSAIREDGTPVYGLGMHGNREIGAVRRLARLLAECTRMWCTCTCTEQSFTAEWQPAWRVSPTLLQRSIHY
jgi:hypothetical protein